MGTKTRSSPSMPDVATSKRWTILALIRTTQEYLEQRDIPDARLSAELLLADVLECPRLDLYLQFDRPVQPDQLEAYRDRVRRRARHEPVAYITGRASFRNLELDVDSRVLIPRPETERLVAEVLDWAAAERQRGRAPAGGWRVVDVGTGSGAIACALATELAGVERVVGVDRSVGALEVARSNAVRLGVSRARWCVAEGLSALRDGAALDAIVSNPPYLAEGERGTMERQVTEWEPAEALFAGHRGDEVVVEIVRDAPRCLRPGGLLAIELADGQASEASRLVEASPGLEMASVYRDLTGRERGVLAIATDR